MAEKVTLKKPDGTIIYPQTQVDTQEIYDAAVTSAKIDWTTVGDVNYSTSELDTGGTWIDGKKIYKKTFSMGALPSSGGSTTKSLSGTTFDTIIDIKGIAYNSTAGNYRLLPFVGVNLDDMLRMDVQNNNTIRIISSSNGQWSGYNNSYITLYYTKSS